MDRKRPLTYLAAFLLLCAFAAQAVTSMRLKSPTCDELAHHIPVGYVLITKGDFKMDPSQPPLARYIAALPLRLFMDVNMPDDKDEWRREDRSEFGKDFFYKYNDRPHRMIFLSRCAIVAVGVLCGIVLFLAANAFFGERAALFSLFLYSFSPNMLAHTRLATTDMTAACFILLAVYSFWIFARGRSLMNVIFAGICLGLAQLSKYTALLLYPAFLLLGAFELPSLSGKERKTFLSGVVFIFAVSIFVIWAGYGFNADPFLHGAMRVGEKVGIAHDLMRKAMPFWNAEWDSRLDNFLFNAPFPLGAHVLGIMGVVKHGIEGHGIFFCGELSDHGNPLYFVVAFLIKTPVPAIIFLIAGFILSLGSWKRREERFLFTVIALFFAAASFNKLQLGLRHILPVYPFCFILAGRSAGLLAKRIYKIPVIALMGWYLISALWIWPDHLSYFNETIGGPKNGYKYLRDSNIDWGQDLPALAEYMKENNIDKIKLRYFGTADPGRYGIVWEPVTAEETDNPGEHVYAISADAVSWDDRYEPTATAGRSIFIYDLRREEKE